MSQDIKTLVNKEVCTAWKVVSEPDVLRNRWEPFTPVRQSLYWLQRGINPNGEDENRRNGFVTNLSTEDDRARYAKGLTGITQMYGQRFTFTTTGEGNTTIIGNYMDPTKGIPALTVREDMDTQQIHHFWIEPYSIRETRLR